MKVVVFAKEKPGLGNAMNFLHLFTNDVYLYEGGLGEQFPEEAYDVKPDITISYISPWIIPSEMLNSTKKWSINFHPGPPEYSGIGCTNFAIYDGAKSFGVTAHIMEEKIDSGRILNVKRFPIYPEDTVYSLTQRCYDNLLLQFYQVMGFIFKKKSAPTSNQKWSRKPYTRKQLNSLCEIHWDMSYEEIMRRIKAVTYPGMPGAYIRINGIRFSHLGDQQNNY